MNEIEYFIFLPVKRFIAGTAKTARYLLPLILLFAVTELLLIMFFGIIETGIIFGKVSDLLLNIFVALLSILTCWCHHVLLARRGNSITRFLCSFAIIMACLMLICDTYTLFTDEICWQSKGKRHLSFLQFYLPLRCSIYPTWQRLPQTAHFDSVVFLLRLAACVTTVIPPICLIFKIIILCIGIPLLRKLQHITP